MSVADRILPYSIEGFLSDHEIKTVLELVDAYKRDHLASMPAGTKNISVHKSPWLETKSIVGVFEPKGRLEINTPDMPQPIADIIENAFYRRIEDIKRAYPLATSVASFTYVEYMPGQFFTPHADGVSRTQCCGFGVTLNEDFTGGDFYVETCGSNRYWTVGPNGDPEVRMTCDASSAAFSRMPKTRWTMRPTQGTAVFYGTALVHGSLPVATGSLKKVLAFVKTGEIGPET